MSDREVLCPFWRESRASFAVRVCDNLADGVPSCLADDFYPDTATAGMSSAEVLEYYPEHMDEAGHDLVVCKHFVRTDALYIVPSKRSCYFGGACVHPDVAGFEACFGCSRFVRGSVSVVWRNVFELWLANGKVLPFSVRRWSWHPETYFVVRRVWVSEKAWSYFSVKGKLYGDAFGDFYLRGKLSSSDIRLECSGCYQWVIVPNR